MFPYIPQIVKGLAWSPDGSWIAVMVGDELCRNGLDDDVLLVPSSETDRGPRRIHLRRCFAASLVGEVSGASNSLDWSPDSESLALGGPAFRGGVIFRLDSGLQHEIPADCRIGGFISEKSLVTKRQRGDNFSLVAYDLDGQQQSEQALGFGADVVAFGPAPRLFIQDAQGARIIDSATNQVLGNGPSLPRGAGQAGFGNQGNVVCTAACPYNPLQNGPLVCYDVLKAAEILPRVKVKNGVPFDVARNSLVLVATDEHKVFSPFIIGSFLGIFSEDRDWPTKRVVKPWVVWDLGQGRSLMELTQAGQAPQGEWREPGRPAMAPDGRRVATAGRDLLRIYNVPAR